MNESLKLSKLRREGSPLLVLLGQLHLLSVPEHRHLCCTVPYLQIFEGQRLTRQLLQISRNQHLVSVPGKSLF